MHNEASTAFIRWRLGTLSNISLNESTPVRLCLPLLGKNIYLLLSLHHNHTEAPYPSIYLSVVYSQKREFKQIFPDWFKKYMLNNLNKILRKYYFRFEHFVNIFKNYKPSRQGTQGKVDDASRLFLKAFSLILFLREDTMRKKICLIK